VRYRVIGMRMRPWRFATAALAAVAVAAAFATTAAADQYFHTSHATLSPIGDASLQSGFVNDIHTNGATISAQERYVLVGAEPNTTYTVSLNIYTNATCTTLVRSVQTATFTTNAAGNGEAEHTFFQTGPWPPTTPPTLRTVYIQWVFSTEGVPQYETGCIPVVVGG
jgi:hypothetical protein